MFSCMKQILETRRKRDTEKLDKTYGDNLPQLWMIEKWVEGERRDKWLEGERSYEQEGYFGYFGARCLVK